MMRISAFLAAMFLTTIAGAQSPESPIGTVTEVADDVVTIRLSTDEAPAMGARLSITVEVKDVGEAQVATATVAAVVGKMLMAKIDQLTGKVMPGQMVHLSSANSRPMPPEKELPKTDLDRLQGIWKCVSTIHEGKPSDRYVGVLAIIEGNNMTWLFPTQDGNRVDQNCDFRIDSNASPKHFDWNPSGDSRVDQRIYTLSEDTLVWAATGPGGPRPESMDAGRWQFTCKRTSEAELGIDVTQIGPLDMPDDARGKPWLGISRVAWNDRQYLLTGVIPNSPAARAGLRMGDILRSLDGERMTPGKSFHAMVESRTEGEKIRVELIRDGKPITQEMITETLPEDGGISKLHFLATLNVPWAQMELSVRYLHQRGYRVGTEDHLRCFVKMDIEKGMEWMRRAAAGGNEWGCLFLAGCYRTGTNVVKDEQQAIHWLQKASEKGFPRAMLQLGIVHETSAQKPDPRTAAALYEQALKTTWKPDDVDARNDISVRLGRLFRTGVGVTVDDSRAVRLFREAAERDDAAAMIELAWMYEQRRLEASEQNLSVRNSNAKAVEWYHKVALKKNARAEYHMGRICAEGRIVAQNNENAYSWYLLAAKNGDADAQAALGSLYESGTGVGANKATAIEWYQKAAAQGHAGAMKRLHELGQS